MTVPTAPIPPPTAVLHEDRLPALETEIKLTTQPETTLQDIPNAMQGSDPSPRTEKEVTPSFWTAYERIAKQHDDEFIERQNGVLDSLLIFAGLFSSVSSSFIVNMESSLSPQPSDTTNALLKVLINKIDNSTFSGVSLPVWTGPSSTIIWIQSLVYTSLSMSLLAAFGAVLGKQWLGHFKTARFGQGTLRERCTRRQRKLDGLKTWNFDTIIASLPILLQLSLLFFGVALAANIWTLQHTVASVIMGATSLGVVFYFFTVVSSLKSPDCPFQNPVSTIINRIMHTFRQTIMVWARQARHKSWAGILRDSQRLLRGIFKSAQDIIARSLARFRIYLLRIRPALRQASLSPIDDPESARGSDELTSFEEIDLDNPADPAGASSIQWILETSTDMDVITTAVQMVPEVEWPDGHDVTFVLNQLTSQLYGYVASPWQLTPYVRERVRTCLKALFHLYTERGMRGPLTLRNHNILDEDCHLYAMPREQAFYLISCVVEKPYYLDISSLPFADRMWMAHILTFRLHSGDQHATIRQFVHDFINKCLQHPKTPPCLVADCLLLAGLMVGLRPDHRYLGRIDKSAAAGYLQGMVIDRILQLLLGEAPVSQRRYALDARKLLRWLAYSKHGQGYYNYQRSVQCLQLCFHLLEDQGTEGHQVQLADVAAALRLSFMYSVMPERLHVWTFLHRRGSDDSRAYWAGPPDWHTQAQFDLLVDYLGQVGQGTDYTVIGDAFAVLAGLRGSPSTLKRKRFYVQMMIRFMESDIPLRTRHAAMSAAHALRTEVASMDRDDEPLRYLFSRALISVIRARDPALQHATTFVDDNQYFELSSINRSRDWRYLDLLCALSKEPTWHGHLDRHGHFKICLAIADTLSSRLRTLDFGRYMFVHLTHLFAIIDTLGEDHQFLRAVKTYPTWRLVLEAWEGLFMEPFFHDTTVENWEEISSWGRVESLPSVAAYTKKYWEQWDNRAETHRLIELVEQVCDKLDEETRRHEQSMALVELEQDNDTIGHRGIPSLSKEIRGLVLVLQRDLSQ